MILFYDDNYFKLRLNNFLLGYELLHLVASRLCHSLVLYIFMEAASPSFPLHLWRGMPLFKNDYFVYATGA